MARFLFICGEFSSFCEKIMKHKYFVTNSLFFWIFKIAKNPYNLQYENKIFYFHILNIAKFGYIYL
jgi:hypothetical protein